MSILEAILFGVVQGVAEFLPISSSGHLTLLKGLFGLQDVPLLFDVLLHVATLLVVVVVFRHRLAALVRSFARRVSGRSDETDRNNLRLILMLIGATAVTGVLGILLESLLDFGAPRSASLLFLVTAVILIASRNRGGERTILTITWKDALIVGFAQGFGVLPGISRAGITIAAGLFSGLDRPHAGEFSFLLSIPAILGALVLTLRDAEALGAGVGMMPVVVGFLSSAVVGLFSLLLLLTLVRSGKLHYFAAYLIPLAVFGLIYFI
ncbi:MAG: undecaprenyl-diphosphate phosphatase [Alkalispirochaetaceae bacterium]